MRIDPNSYDDVVIAGVCDDLIVYKENGKVVQEISGPGGPGLYASVTLKKFGRNPLLITKANKNCDSIRFLRENDISVVVFDQSGITTLFENTYHRADSDFIRTQRMLLKAPSFNKDDLEQIIQLTEGKKVMLMPISGDDEIPPYYYNELRQSTNSLIAAPQGATRTADENLNIHSSPFTFEYLEALSNCDSLVLSEEDTLGFRNSDIEKQLLRNTADTVLFTRGAQGISVYHNQRFNREPHNLPSFSLTNEEMKYPNMTGNGDMVAALFSIFLPNRVDNLSDFKEFDKEVSLAYAKIALCASYKIHTRDIRDGIASIPTPNEVRTWALLNRKRVESYANQLQIDAEILFNLSFPNPEGGFIRKIERK